MKAFICVLFVLFFAPSFKAQDGDFTSEEKNMANTAKDAEYFSPVERDVIYYMNLCRMNPKKFLRVVLEEGYYVKDNEDYIKKSPKYLTSLKQKLKSMKPLTPLSPDKNLYEMALCLAKEQEKSGVTGHERKKCKKDYYGECCSYGEDTAEGIVLQLLIDQDVPSLGHRKIILGEYTQVGVAKRSHKRYRSCAVLDFR